MIGEEWNKTCIGAGVMIRSKLQNADFGRFEIYDSQTFGDVGRSIPEVYQSQDTSVINDVLSWISSTSSSIVGSASAAYDSARDIVASGTTYVSDKLSEAKQAMQDAVDIKREVDAKIASMPEGPDKEAMKTKRDDSAGIFVAYVLPAWEKFADLTGLDKNPDKALGIEPLTATVAIAAVAAAIALASAAIYYIDLQKDILKDPRLSAEQASGLLESFSLGGITKNIKTPFVLIGIAGILIGGYLILGRFSKNAKIS